MEYFFPFHSPTKILMVPEPFKHTISRSSDISVVRPYRKNNFYHAAAAPLLVNPTLSERKMPQPSHRQDAAAAQLLLQSQGWELLEFTTSLQLAIHACVDPVLHDLGEGWPSALSHSSALTLRRPPHMPEATCTRLLEWLPRETPLSSPRPWPPHVAAFAELLELGMRVLQKIEAWSGAPKGSLQALVTMHEFDARESALGDGTKWRWIAYERAMQDAAVGTHLGGGTPIICNAHTDGGLITIAPTSNRAGLELQSPCDSWRPAPAAAGTALVFCGDLMAAITNGRLRSLPHRVVAACSASCACHRCVRDGEPCDAGSVRLATPFFVRSHANARIPLALLRTFWPSAACAHYFPSPDGVSAARLLEVFAYVGSHGSLSLSYPPRHDVRFVQESLRKQPRLATTIPRSGSSDGAARDPSPVPVHARASPFAFALGDDGISVAWLLSQLKGSDWHVLEQSLPRPPPSTVTASTSADAVRHFCFPFLNDDAHPAVVMQRSDPLVADLESMRTLIGDPLELLGTSGAPPAECEASSRPPAGARYMRCRIAACERIPSQSADGPLQWQGASGIGSELVELLAQAEWGHSDLDPRSVQLFVAVHRRMHSIVSPLHFDQAPMVICQLRGRKRVLLIPPAAYGRLLPYPSCHSLDRRARLDAGKCSVDVATARAMGGVEVVLEPGEALYIPAFAWHEVSTVPAAADAASTCCSETSGGSDARPTGDVLRSACEENASFSVRLKLPVADASRLSEVKSSPCALWLGVGRNVETAIVEAVDAHGGRLLDARGCALLLLHIACAMYRLAGDGEHSVHWRDHYAYAWDGSGIQAAVMTLPSLMPTLLRFVGGSYYELAEFLRRLPVIGVPA